MGGTQSAPITMAFIQNLLHVDVSFKNVLQDYSQRRVVSKFLSRLLWCKSLDSMMEHLDFVCSFVFGWKDGSRHKITAKDYEIHFNKWRVHPLEFRPTEFPIYFCLLVKTNMVMKLLSKELEVGPLYARTATTAQSEPTSTTIRADGMYLKYLYESSTSTTSERSKKYSTSSTARQRSKTGRNGLFNVPRVREDVGGESMTFLEDILMGSNGSKDCWQSGFTKDEKVLLFGTFLDLSSREVSGEQLKDKLASATDLLASDCKSPSLQTSFVTGSKLLVSAIRRHIHLKKVLLKSHTELAFQAEMDGSIQARENDGTPKYDVYFHMQSNHQIISRIEEEKDNIVKLKPIVILQMKKLDKLGSDYSVFLVKYNIPLFDALDYDPTTFDWKNIDAFECESSAVVTSDDDSDDDSDEESSNSSISFSLDLSCGNEGDECDGEDEKTTTTTTQFKEELPFEVKSDNSGSSSSSSDEDYVDTAPSEVVGLRKTLDVLKHIGERSWDNVKAKLTATTASSSSCCDGESADNITKGGHLSSYSHHHQHYHRNNAKHSHLRYLDDKTYEHVLSKLKLTLGHLSLFCKWFYANWLNYIKDPSSVTNATSAQQSICSISESKVPKRSHWLDYRCGKVVTWNTYGLAKLRKVRQKHVSWTTSPFYSITVPNSHATHFPAKDYAHLLRSNLKNILRLKYEYLAANDEFTTNQRQGVKAAVKHQLPVKRWMLASLSHIYSVFKFGSTTRTPKMEKEITVLFKWGKTEHFAFLASFNYDIVLSSGKTRVIALFDWLEQREINLYESEHALLIATLFSGLVYERLQKCVYDNFAVCKANPSNMLHRFVPTTQKKFPSFVNVPLPKSGGDITTKSSSNRSKSVPTTQRLSSSRWFCEKVIPICLVDRGMIVNRTGENSTADSFQRVSLTNPLGHFYRYLQNMTNIYTYQAPNQCDERTFKQIEDISMMLHKLRMRLFDILRFVLSKRLVPDVSTYIKKRASNHSINSKEAKARDLRDGNIPFALLYLHHDCNESKSGNTTTTTNMKEDIRQFRRAWSTDDITDISGEITFVGKARVEEFCDFTEDSLPALHRATSHADLMYNVSSGECKSSQCDLFGCSSNNSTNNKNANGTDSSRTKSSSATIASSINNGAVSNELIPSYLRNAIPSSVMNELLPGSGSGIDNHSTTTTTTTRSQPGVIATNSAAFPVSIGSETNKGKFSSKYKRTTTVKEASTLSASLSNLQQQQQQQQQQADTGNKPSNADATSSTSPSSSTWLFNVENLDEQTLKDKQRQQQQQQQQQQQFAAAAMPSALSSKAKTLAILKLFEKCLCYRSCSRIIEVKMIDTANLVAVFYCLILRMVFLTLTGGYYRITPGLSTSSVLSLCGGSITYNPINRVLHIHRTADEYPQNSSELYNLLFTQPDVSSSVQSQGSYPSNSQELETMLVKYNRMQEMQGNDGLFNYTYRPFFTTILMNSIFLYGKGCSVEQGNATSDLHSMSKFVTMQPCFASLFVKEAYGSFSDDLSYLRNTVTIDWEGFRRSSDTPINAYRMNMDDVCNLRILWDYSNSRTHVPPVLNPLLMDTSPSSSSPPMQVKNGVQTKRRVKFLQVPAVLGGSTGIEAKNRSQGLVSPRILDKEFWLQYYYESPLSAMKYLHPVAFKSIKFEKYVLDSMKDFREGMIHSEMNIKTEIDALFSTTQNILNLIWVQENCANTPFPNTIKDKVIRPQNATITPAKLASLVGSCDYKKLFPLPTSATKLNTSGGSRNSNGYMSDEDADAEDEATTECEDEDAIQLQDSKLVSHFVEIYQNTVFQAKHIIPHAMSQLSQMYKNSSSIFFLPRGDEEVFECSDALYNCSFGKKKVKAGAEQAVSRKLDLRFISLDELLQQETAVGSIADVENTKFFHKLIGEAMERVKTLSKLLESDFSEQKGSSWENLDKVLTIAKDIKDILTNTYNFKLYCVIRWNKAFSANQKDKNIIWKYLAESSSLLSSLSGCDNNNTSNSSGETKVSKVEGETTAQKRRKRKSGAVGEAAVSMYGGTYPHMDSNKSQQIRLETLTPLEALKPPPPTIVQPALKVKQQATNVTNGGSDDITEPDTCPTIGLGLTQCSRAYLHKLSSFDLLSAEELDGLRTLLRLYEGGTTPISINNTLGHLPLTVFNRLYFFFRTLRFFSSIKLTRLPDEIAQQIHHSLRFSKYKLFTGEVLPKSNRVVYLTPCCERICCYEHPKSHGSKKLAFSSAENTYICAQKKMPKCKRMGLCDLKWFGMAEKLSETEILKYILVQHVRRAEQIADLSFRDECSEKIVELSKKCDGLMEAMIAKRIKIKEQELSGIRQSHSSTSSNGSNSTNGIKGEHSPSTLIINPTNTFNNATNTTIATTDEKTMDKIARRYKKARDRQYCNGSIAIPIDLAGKRISFGTKHVKQYQHCPKCGSLHEHVVRNEIVLGGYMCKYCATDIPEHQPDYRCTYCLVPITKEQAAKSLKNSVSIELGSTDTIHSGEVKYGINRSLEGYNPNVLVGNIFCETHEFKPIDTMNRKKTMTQLNGNLHTSKPATATTPAVNKSVGTTKQHSNWTIISTLDPLWLGEHAGLPKKHDNIFTLEATCKPSVLATVQSFTSESNDSLALPSCCNCHTYTNTGSTTITEDPTDTFASTSDEDEDYTYQTSLQDIFQNHVNRFKGRGKGRSLRGCLHGSFGRRHVSYDLDEEGFLREKKGGCGDYGDYVTNDGQLVSPNLNFVTATTIAVPITHIQSRGSSAPATTSTRGGGGRGRIIRPRGGRTATSTTAASVKTNRTTKQKQPGPVSNTASEKKIKIDSALQLISAKHKCLCPCHYSHDPTGTDFPTSLYTGGGGEATAETNNSQQRQKPLSTLSELQSVALKLKIEATRIALKEKIEFEKRLRTRQQLKNRAGWLTYDNTESNVPLLVKNAKGFIIGSSAEGVLKSRMTKRQKVQRTFTNMTPTEKGALKNKQNAIYKLYNTRKGYYSRNTV